VVYDADGSTPVEGATVALGALSAVSAADGTYSIADIPAGASGSMTCTKTGYSWTAITIAAMSANLTSQNYTNTWWAANGVAASGVAAYQPKGAASFVASKINLVTPGVNNATDGTNYPTWNTTDGWIFAKANSQYLAAGFSASLKPFTLIALINFPVELATNRVVMGGSGYSCIEYGITKINYKPWYNKSGAVAIGLASTGLSLDQPQVGAVSYSAAGVYQMYLNGTPDATGTNNQTFTERTAIIGASNNGAGEPFNGYICALAYYNTVLSPAQVAAIGSAMLAATAAGEQAVTQSVIQDNIWNEEVTV
jgi:hypothetical protein